MPPQMTSAQRTKPIVDAPPRRETGQFLNNVLDICVTYIYVLYMHKAPHHRGRRSPRGRRRQEDGSWLIKPPLTPLIEPALLIALRDGMTHGYDLADRIGESLGISRIDHGNLYRGLRKLEEEGIVTSEWNDGAPGRSKRTYSLTDDGEALLAAWAETLQFTKERLDALLSDHKGSK